MLNGMLNLIIFVAALVVVSLIGLLSVQLLVNQHKAVEEGRAVTNPQTPLIIVGVAGLYPYAGVLFLISKNIVIVNSEELTVAIFMLLYYGTVALLCLLWENNIFGVKDFITKTSTSAGQHIYQKLDKLVDQVKSISNKDSK